MLEVGVKAPDFTLKDKDGKEVALSSFRGKKVVLYFYPKDNTPGCTRQACAFAGAYAGFKERNVEVIGARSVQPNAMESPPARAEPMIQDGMTRSGSCAAKGMAPSVMKDSPMT